MQANTRPRYERRYNPGAQPHSTLGEAARTYLNIEVWHVYRVDYNQKSQVFRAFDQTSAQKIASFLKQQYSSMGAGSYHAGGSLPLTADLYKNNYVIERDTAWMPPEVLPVLQKAGIKVKVLGEREF